MKRKYTQKDAVALITNNLVSYKNTEKLSWMKVYEEILVKLEMEDRINDNKLLNNVISSITRLGYDIMPLPFKLKKFR